MGSISRHVPGGAAPTGGPGRIQFIMQGQILQGRKGRIGEGRGAPPGRMGRAWAEVCIRAGLLFLREGRIV